MAIHSLMNQASLSLWYLRHRCHCWVMSLSLFTVGGSENSMESNLNLAFARYTDHGQTENVTMSTRLWDEWMEVLLGPMVQLWPWGWFYSNACVCVWRPNAQSSIQQLSSLSASCASCTVYGQLINTRGRVPPAWVDDRGSGQPPACTATTFDFYSYLDKPWLLIKEELKGTHGPNQIRLVCLNKHREPYAGELPQRNSRDHRSVTSPSEYEHWNSLGRWDLTTLL